MDATLYVQGEWLDFLIGHVGTSAVSQGAMMSDLELIRACAEAMKLGQIAINGGEVIIGVTPNRYVYDPLHDDAQAMALVRKFRLDITDVETPYDEHVWGVSYFAPDYGEREGDFDETTDRHIVATNADLNRAIVECVAKMPKAQPESKPSHAPPSFPDAPL